MKWIYLLAVLSAALSAASSAFLRDWITMCWALNALVWICIAWANERRT